MFFNCAFTDSQKISDFLIAFAICHQVQDLLFTRRQVLLFIFAHKDAHLCSGLAADPSFRTGSYAAHRLNDHLWRLIFNQIACRAIGKNAEYILLVGVGAKRQDAHWKIVFLNRLGYFNAGQLGHFNVKNQHIWLMKFDQRNNIGAVICFRHNHNVWRLLQKCANPRPHHGMVIS